MAVATRRKEGGVDQSAVFRRDSSRDITDQPAEPAGLGHPLVSVYDEARGLFVETGLAPEPPAYELFFLHLTGADPALSRDIDRAIEDGVLDQDRILALRRAHLGEIASSEVHEIVSSARGSMERLGDRLSNGRTELEAHDEALASEDEALTPGRSAEHYAGVVQRLRRANARMMAANRRLEADISRTAKETAVLLDRLESAERAARTDALTGLLNRRGLTDALRNSIEAAGRKNQPLAVAIIDIDHFKKIIDQWGHSIGDEVLRYVGTFLSHCLKARPDCFAGRPGGEEFLAIFPGMPLEAACAAVEAIRAALARQVVRRASDGATLGRITFSAGVAFLRPEDAAETLVDRADAALYAAKRAGRDRVLPELPDRR
jgi:diguanylate cyclase